MNNPPKMLRFIKPARIAFVLLGFALAAGTLFAWSAPPSGVPPTCPSGQPGCDAPINVSNTFQSKDGNLMVNAGGSFATGFSVPFGNVGIGTVAPTQKLDINGITTFGGGNGYIRHDDSGIFHFQAGTSGYSFANNVNNTTLVRILDTGNVGIGTANPGYKLDVKGDFWLQNTGVANSILISAGGAGGVNRVSSNFNPGGAYLPLALSANVGVHPSQLYLNTAGNVGIGTAAPGAKLEVNGQIKITGGGVGVGKVLTSDASGLASWGPAGAGGDITDVLGGTGITVINSGGPIVTVNADTTYLQRAIVNACAGANKSIKTINSDGTVTCETDDIGGGGGPEVDTLQTVTGRGATTNLSITTAGLNLNGVGNEGNVSALNQLVGYNDLFLKGNSGETAPIYYGASDHHFYTGGAEKLTINAGGNVGIGTAVPGKILDVRGADNGNSAMFLYKGTNQVVWLGTGSSAAGDESGYLGLYNNAGSVGAQINTQGDSWITGGNVGIGTTVPGTKLQVNGTFKVVGADTYAKIQMNDTNTVLSPGSSVGGVYVNNHDNSASLVTVLNSGNVGIGTASPAKQLVVGNYPTTGGEFGVATNNSNSSIQLFSQSIGAIIQTNVSPGSFLPAGTVIGANGGGVTTYGYVGGTSAGGMVRMNFSTNGSNSGFRISSDFTDVFAINSGGNVGIGTVTPGYKLDVAGQVNATCFSVLGGPCLSGADTLQTVTGRGATTNLSITTAGLNLNGVGNEGNVSALNQLVGYNDLFLKGNSGETAPIYYGASDHHFYTGGTEKFTILGSGNVGIGTAAPGYKLHVRGADATANLVIGNTTEDTRLEVLTYQDDRVVLRANDSVARVLSFESGTSEKMRITTSGNVGIGTVAPVDKLDVNGHIALSGGTKEIRFRNAAGAVEQYVWHSGTSLGLGAGGAGNSMFITIAGNVGIGTAAPGYKLDVAGDVNATCFRVAGGPCLSGASGGPYLPLAGGTMDGGSRVGFNGGASYGIGQGAATPNLNSIAVDTLETDGGVGGGGTLELNYYGGNAVMIGPSGTKPLYAAILYDGNNPGYYVDPASGSNVNWLTGTDLYVNSWFRNNAQFTGLYNTANGNHFYSETPNYWTVTSAGNVAGGLIFREQHQGTLRGYVYHDATGFGLLSSDGNWRIRTNPGQQELFGNTYSGTFIYTASDESLKKDIKTIPNALESILKLRGVTFNWRTDGTASMGVIAQEVEKVYPELVHTTPLGLKAVQYDGLVGPLIEALKAEDEKIGAQQKRIDELEKVVEELKKRS